MLVFERYLEIVEFPYIFVIWGIGIINFILNVYLGEKLKIKNWAFIMLVISGLTWAFPPLFFTFFGIPFLIIYLIIGVYIHRQTFTKSIAE